MKNLLPKKVSFQTIVSLNYPDCVTNDPAVLRLAMPSDFLICSRYLLLLLTLRITLLWLRNVSARSLQLLGRLQGSVGKVAKQL